MTAHSFADLYREAKEHDDYWVAGLVHDFTEALARRMEEQGVSRAELARRIGTSQAYVTRVLRGNVNFTLATLVKLARAVGGEVRLDLRQPAARVTKPAVPAARAATTHRAVIGARVARAR
jgi:transcriptional regulator with XRE-family HTH domain